MVYKGMVKSQYILAKSDSGDVIRWVYPSFFLIVLDESEQVPPRFRVAGKTSVEVQAKKGGEWRVSPSSGFEVGRSCQNGQGNN